LALSATALTTLATGSGSFCALCFTVSLRFDTVSCTFGDSTNSFVRLRISSNLARPALVPST
jgi:hypothetical protein